MVSLWRFFRLLLLRSNSRVETKNEQTGLEHWILLRSSVSLLFVGDERAWVFVGNEQGLLQLAQ